MTDQDDTQSSEQKLGSEASSQASNINETNRQTRLQIPNSTIRRTKSSYSPCRELQYRNNLLLAVGVFEFSNALDFPANVWNQIPVPLFAQVLMGVGGSIAILWSFFAWWDLHRSLHNIRVLRQERRFLKAWQDSFDDEDSSDTRRLVRGYLDVNFRELGWEGIDRMLLDVCAGASGLLVGIGAILAIRGADETIFMTSNLMSGYIGNSLLAPFALGNSLWAIFMWKRAGGAHDSITNGKYRFSLELRARMKSHGRKHKVYAVVNGVTALVGTVGSIMSATLWYGYVLVAPCVITSIFCVILWRYHMGYNRMPILKKSSLRGFDILSKLETILMVRNAIETDSVGRFEHFVSNDVPSARMLEFMATIGLYDEFCCRLLRDEDLAEKLLDGLPNSATLEPAQILTVEPSTLRRAAKSTMTDDGKQRLIEEERFLVEVYGRYLDALVEEEK